MILRVALPLSALALFGAAAPLPPMTPAEKVAAANVRAHVEYLADDRLEGRDTGSRGYQLGADYVAAQFARIGLEPAAPGGGWFQPVPYRRAFNGPASITLDIAGRSYPLELGRDAAIRPSLTERHRTINAPLVFAGFGLDEPLLHRTDYQGLDVRGKIVVVLKGAPKSLSPDIAAHVRSTKAETAAARGAIGLIEVGGDAPGLDDRAMFDWVDSDGGAGLTPHGMRASITLSQAWQARLFEGSRESLANVQAEARNRIPGAFDLAARLSLSVDSSWQDYPSPEVIGRLPGTTRTDETVVVMAHLDHLGMNAEARPGEHAVYNGALDNAAGVATMIEAAREIAATGHRARSILFIANSGEEKGLLGAAWFAAHPTVPIERIVAVVDLDMPLPLYEFRDVFVIGGDHSTLAQTVAAAGRPMGVSVSPDPMPRESLFIRSDHYRFVQRGVPAILLMTGYANGGERVWKDFLAHIYHSPRDNLLQPIDWRVLARYGMLNARIAQQLADAPDRPRWIAGDYFGNRFAPGQPRALRVFAGH
ncbi:MAG: M20/M25/M40 family metallo-hydrolase [Sphingomicrobium sp.]